MSKPKIHYEVAFEDASVILRVFSNDEFCDEIYLPKIAGATSVAHRGLWQSWAESLNSGEQNV